ncbi:major facilitator superfamily domain-containing protein [Fennellomyces sp. T-0311]|nr:major facilitator superfamily domain-containing protein [Fennellomyces sp. T-0311]
MDSRQAGVRPTVIFSALVASLGTFNCGVNTSALNIPSYFVRNCPNVPSGQISYYPGSGLTQCIPMNDWVWGIATGMFAIGGLIGAMTVGPLATRMGRRDSMFFINIAFLIGAALTGMATTSAQLTIGRAVLGIGSGAMSVLVSMYIAEIAPPAQRGALVGCLQLLATCGILYIELCGLGLRSWVGWRVATTLTVVPAIIQTILLPFCVRSPRWLISRNRIEEARTALLKLRHGDIEGEFLEMVRSSGNTITASSTSSSISKDSIVADQQGYYAATAIGGGIQKDQENPAPQKEQQEPLSLVQVMRIPLLAVLVIKMMILHAGFQLSGISAIMYYSTSIFQATFGTDEAAYVTVGAAVVYVAFTGVGLALVDRLGRKSLILFSSVTMCLFSVVLTIGMVLNISALQVVCIMLNVASFAVGLGIVPFLFTSESFPTYAVGAACSAGLMSNWFFNFLTGFTFPPLLSICGDYVFLLFAGFMLLTAIFVHFFAVETARKSIEDIGRQLGWYDLDVKQALGVQKS